MRSLTTLLVLLLGACGAKDRESDSQMGADAGPDDGATDMLVGTVWAPGNAPGMVPMGHEIPVAGATVYLATEKPEPIPQKVECMECTEAPPNAVLTDSKGRFEIMPRDGTFWLVVQKAQFRLEQQIDVEGGRVLPPEMTTLPSEMDPENGKWMPRIALASGSYDMMETILGKMRIGQVSSDGTFQSGSAAGHFDVYFNGGTDANYDEWGPQGSVTDLVGNLDKMLEYHIIFFPCTSSELGWDDEGNPLPGPLADPAVLKNIRDYVKAGGRLYVADWAGEWMDDVFPTQIELKNGEMEECAPDDEFCDPTYGRFDTPTPAYDPATDTWDPAQFGNADAFPEYDSQGAHAVDPDLAAWLDGQIDPSGYPIDAENMEIVENYNRIGKLNPVTLGTDEEGNEVVDEPRAYVSGPGGEWDGEDLPLMATYEPAGCGRVLYSTFHTTATEHSGLLAQERILVYLLMEIGQCVDENVVD